MRNINLIEFRAQVFAELVILTLAAEAAVFALPGTGARVGGLVAHEMPLADEESLASAVATLELAIRIVPLHVIVEALAGVEALLA